MTMTPISRERVENEHEYLRMHVDPIIMPMIEKLVLYQPTDVYAFMKRDLDGEPLGPVRFGKSRSLPTSRRRIMASFMTEKVLPVMETFTQRVLVERPSHVKSFVQQMVSLELTSNNNVVVSNNTLPPMDSVILVLGLDGAGKSTLLSTLTGDVNKKPTSFGFDKVSFQVGDGKTTFYDLGGGSTIRNVWKEYYADAHGIIFVVDASDDSSMKMASSVLQDTLHDAMCANKPLLVYANKQDKNEESTCVGSFLSRLGVEKVQLVKGVPCVAKTLNNNGVDERLEVGLTWLFETVEENYKELQERVINDTKLKRRLYADKIKAQKVRVQARMEEKERGTMEKEDQMQYQADDVQLEVEPVENVPMCAVCAKFPATVRNKSTKWQVVCDTCCVAMAPIDAVVG